MAVATLLPNGEQQFCDANGAPYAGGSVYFYVPSTTTPKTTWADAAENTPNTNPVVLDSAGRAVIYGSGQYRQVLFDSLGNEVWDQLTQDVYSLIDQGAAIWGGTATGTANALNLTSTPLLTQLTAGQLIAFIAASNNTTAITVNVSGLGVTPVKVMSSSGLVPLVANNLIAGGRYLLLFDGVNFVLLNPTTPAVAAGFVNLASATTTDLGSAGSNNINVTGTATITSFGASATLGNPLYYVVFSGSLLITAGANIVTPNGQNVTTQPGDFALLQYLGTGVWNILSYFPAAGYIGSINVVQVSSSETYFASTNLVYVMVEMVGGGGGGGGSSGQSFGGGGGGGAGGYLRALLSAAAVGTSQVVTVGAGGLSGTGNGGTGGTTSFGSLLVCTGGNGGTGEGGEASFSPGGAGGGISITAGQAIVYMGGQNGGVGYQNSQAECGGGGSTPLGFGAPFNACAPESAAAATLPTGYGSGGGGAINSNNGAVIGGSAGMPGLVIITEYLYK